MVRISGIEELQSHDYVNMVARLAWQTWQKLPEHTRAWISVEDIMLDGVRWVELKGLVRWDKKKASLSTLLYLGLGNYYETYYLQKYCIGNQKRSEHLTTSIQAQEERCRQKGEEFELERALGLRVVSQKEIERQILNCMNCMAVDHMTRVYQQASTPLQNKIRDWFLADVEWQTAEIKWGLKSKEFAYRAREFRMLAQDQGLTIGECRHIFASPGCFDRLSREITWMPATWQAEVYR